MPYKDALTEWLQHPATMMGLGMLGASGRGVPSGQAIGRGGLMGLENMRRNYETESRRQASDARAMNALTRRQALQDAQMNQQRVQGHLQAAQMAIHAGDEAAARQHYQMAAALDSQATTAAMKGATFGAPQFKAVGPGSTYGQVDPLTGQLTMQGQTPQAPGTVVKLPPQERAESATVGKGFGAEFMNYMNAAKAASTNNNQLKSIDKLLDNVYTGAGGDIILSAKKLARLFGMDPKGIGSAEAAKALAAELALQFRNPAGGEGLPGHLSDKDLDFLQSMTPNLAMTKEGRKLLIEVRRRINNRQIELAKMARKFRNERGAFGPDFLDVADEYNKANPLFDDLVVPGEEAAPAAADKPADWNDVPGQ